MRTGQPINPDATAVMGLDHTGNPPSPHGAPKRKKRMSKRAKIILGFVLVPLILLGVGLVSAGVYLQSVEGNLERVEAFEGLTEADRPKRDAAAGEALNFLLLGSDSRDPNSDGGSRSDTIIVMHLNKDKSAAQLISIPRDTWVFVPKAPNGRYGNTNAKINAAFAWGGIPLMVKTVENYTGVRIDHVAMVDFSGFKEIVDALGGVDIDVETAFTSTHSLNADGKRRFEAGKQTMDGAAALDYARERYAFKDGDFARIRHQQQVIKAILDKAASGGTLSSPTKLNGFLQATSNTVGVDNDLNMLDMGMQVRGLRSSNLNFYTSPNKGTGRVGDQSVVLPDKEKAKTLFDAVRTDDTATVKKIAEG
jgi:LCP family protein required for cell wall assembly